MPHRPARHLTPVAVDAPAGNRERKLFIEKDQFMEPRQPLCNAAATAGSLSW